MYCSKTMKSKWILLLIGIVLLLVLFGRREGFNPATERPSASDPSIRATVKAYANLPNDSDPKIGKYITAIQEYYDTKFLPEKTSNSAKIAEFLNGQRDPDLDKQILTRILDYIFLTTDSTGTTTSSPPPAGPAGGQADPGASSGTTGATGATGATGTTSPSSSSLSKFAQRVWGPAFVELGQGDGGNGDSTKTTVYPELLGGLGDRYEGGEGPGEGKIQFPSLGSLGLGENARFFPFSRSPGDMEMIMDPYRVSQTFSAASYSPGPEPSPFLADFSKFQ